MAAQCTDQRRRFETESGCHGERESNPITMFWGLCSQQGPEAAALVRKAAEAGSLLAFGRPTKATKYAELIWQNVFSLLKSAVFE